MQAVMTDQALLPKIPAEIEPSRFVARILGMQ
jgi:hypothetical protein